MQNRGWDGPGSGVGGKSKPNVGLTTENKANKPIFGGIYCPKVTQIRVYLTAWKKQEDIWD